MQTLHQTTGNYNYLHIDWGDEKEAQISKQFSKYYKKIQESHLTLKICDSEVCALFCTVEVLGLHTPAWGLQRVWSAEGVCRVLYC